MFETGMALLFILENRWEQYASALHRAQSDTREESIHEFRIAIRRLISCLILTRGLVEAEAHEELNKSLKKTLKSLGRTRDFQVTLRELNKKPQVPKPLKNRLQNIDKQKQLFLPKALAEINFPRQTELFSHIWENLSQSQIITDDRNLRKVIAQNVRSLAKEYRKKMQKINLSKSKSYHRARKSLRQLRYSLEDLEGAVDIDHSQKINRLKRQQAYFGRVQDLEVMTDILKSLSQDLPQTERPPVKKIKEKLLKEKRKRQLKVKNQTEKNRPWVKNLAKDLDL
jgi:CHAD domain-containing protein